MVTHKIRELSWAGPDSDDLPGMSWLVGCLGCGEAGAGAAGDNFRTAPLSCFGFIFYFFVDFSYLLPRRLLRGPRPGLAAALPMAARWRHLPAAPSVRGPRGPEGAAGRERAGKRGICTIFRKKGRCLGLDLRMLSSLISRKGDFRNSSS